MKKVLFCAAMVAALSMAFVACGKKKAAEEDEEGAPAGQFQQGDAQDQGQDQGAAFDDKGGCDKAAFEKGGYDKASYKDAEEDQWAAPDYGHKATYDEEAYPSQNEWGAPAQNNYGEEDYAMPEEFGDFEGAEW